jgi:hypothetical protein
MDARRFLYLGRSASVAPMSSGAVERLFRCRWPRLYLDTAELIAIGRSQLPPSLVDELLEVMYQHAVVLVVSHAHMCDALKPGNVDAPELLASTLERFWILGRVVADPLKIEPWTHGKEDIEILPWGNVREVVNSPLASTNLKEHSVVQTIVYSADLVSKAVQQSTAHPAKDRLSSSHRAILVGALKRLIIGLDQDVGSAVDWCAQALSLNLTPEERSRLSGELAPAETAISIVAPLLSEMPEQDRFRMSEIMFPVADAAPGRWLSTMLAANRYRNIGRTPSRSDSIDLMHCTFVPYVDIFTCDRQAFAALTPHLGSVKGTRAPRVFRNGQLGDVIRYIKSLATRTEIEQDILASEV